MEEQQNQIGDWYELCSFADGVPREFELTAMQFHLVVKLLGLESAELCSDAYIAETLLPLILSVSRADEG